MGPVMSQTPAEPIKTLPLVMEEPRGRKKPPRHLADLTPAERKALLEEQGLPGFRAKQLSTHYFARLVDDPEQMTDLPSGQRADLVGALLPELMTPLRTMEADKGTTRKVLWKLFDGALVESVLMRYPDRATMCVSSQAGCGMACPFCATGQGGLQRNMSTAEIVEQVVAGARSLARGEVPGGPGRVSNVVFMGMGEPLANYKAVIGAVRRLTDPTPDGLGMSARGVTVSTVGLVPRIKQLATEGIPVTLALSLHAPDDELRNELVPINRKYPIAELMAACRRYTQGKDRKSHIVYEYVMLDGINDSPALARDLAKLLGDMPAKVNLIPFNPFPQTDYRRSRPEAIRAFSDVLRQRRIITTIRKTRGDDIDAACGQLVGRVQSRQKNRLRQIPVVTQ